MNIPKLIAKSLKDLHVEEIEGVGFRGTIPIAPKFERTQVVMVIYGGVKGCIIASNFASTRDMTPQMAFKLAAEIPYGISLTDGDGEYHVKHVIFEDDITEAAIRRHYLLVGMIADQLEEYTGADKY